MIDREQIGKKIEIYNAKCKLLGIEPLKIEITGNNIVAFGNRRKAVNKYIIPDFVTAIGTNAFYSCIIDSIVIPKNINHVDLYAFENCKNLKSVIIKANITRICENTFNSCRKLTHIELPESIKSIEERAFYDCESLEEIQLPSTVESIGRDAFMYCSSLKEIVIPEGIKSIEKYPLSNCSKLERIYVPKCAESFAAEYEKILNCTKIVRY